MTRCSLTAVADDALLRNLRALVAQDRVTTAALLAHISEVDERRLYRPAGYPSMYAYCVGELRMSEDMACRRIEVARAARAYPRILPAIESGELSLSTVNLLAELLTPLNADELLTAAAGRSKREVERLIAERFPKPDVPTVLTSIAASSMSASSGTFCLPAPARVEEAIAAPAPGQVETAPPSGASPAPPAPARVGEASALSAPARVEQPRPRIAPLAPGRFALQLTVNQNTHDQLRYAQELLGQTAANNVAAVLERALNLLVQKLEQKTFAKCVRSGPKRGSKNPRHVPAEVRRQVWQRDGGRCTFTSVTGKRCDARTRLEFDHIEPIARGGKTATSNLRLCCRAHNQYLAECALGSGFMKTKRERAQQRAAAPGARTVAPSSAP